MFRAAMILESLMAVERADGFSLMFRNEENPFRVTSASGSETAGQSADDSQRSAGLLGWLMAGVSFLFVTCGLLVIGVIGIPILGRYVQMPWPSLLPVGLFPVWVLLSVLAGFKTAVDTIRIHRRRRK